MGSTSAAAPIPRPSRRKIDYEAAFQFWANPDGRRRSYHEVAREFGVAEPTIVRIASREDWPQRAWAIEDEARRQADKRAAKSVAQRVEQALAIVDATKQVYAKGLQSGKTVVSASEMVAMLRLESMLVGGPSERVAGESDGYRRSLQEIEAELAELEPQQVDALLAADQAVRERVAALPAGEPGDPQRHPSPSPNGADATPIQEPLSGPVAADEDADAETLVGEVVGQQSAAERLADPFARWQDGRGPLQRVVEG